MTKDTPFTLVTGKRNRQKHKKFVKDQNNAAVRLQSLHLTTTDIDAIRIRKVVQENIEDLKTNEIYLKLVEILKSFTAGVKKEFICLGLGPLSSYISRHQLALGVLLQQQIRANTVKYSDPCFTVGDKQILEHFDIQVIEENLEGKYLSQHDYITVFYLPHCPKQLVNNLLWKNWTPNIKNIALITNSFETILERTPSRFLSASAEYIVKASRYITEYKLPEYTEASDIFNDLSLIQFNKFENIDSNFWKDPAEPVYQAEDLELILAN